MRLARFASVLAAIAALSLVPATHAQQGAQSADDTVVINLPERIELQVIIDYVGKALGVRFAYAEEFVKQSVELRPSPVELPKRHLLRLLVTLLRVRGLALVETSPTFYRIVRTDERSRAATSILPADAALDNDSMRMVTQVLPVPSGDVRGVGERLATFMSSPKGGLVSVPERGLIIVTDYEARLPLLQELITLLTAGAGEIEVRTFPAGTADATALAAQVTAILTERHRLRNTKRPPAAVRGDIVPGAVVVVGTRQQISHTTRLLDTFAPAAVDLATRPYLSQYLSVDRAKALIDNVVLAPGSGMTPPARIYEDKQSGRLFVTAEAATHAAIESLLAREDRPLPETQRPLRVYRPRFRKVGELLGTLSQLLGEGAALVQHPVAPAAARSGTAPGLSAPNRAATRRSVPPTPPVSEDGATPTATGASRLRVTGPDYVLTEDEHTNAILAIGTREFHAQLEALIEQLDKRRPQVLIEMTLVAITMSDSLDLGVELESLDLGDGWDFLAFSNFGLSSIDVTTGDRTLNPGLGGNGIILRPGRVPIIMQALATHGDARVYSTPKLLVADNARATLRNVDEAPFTSVNASDTVATTSFAGFESAGTTLSITPHISDGDHVTLEYELTFSNFTGSSSAGAVPPPRTTNSFISTVEVPNEHVVVTGGLTVKNHSDAVSEVPLLGRIPLLGVLFQSSSKQQTQTKIFAFIRPTILRDESLETLQEITHEDLERAEIRPEHLPVPDPLWMP